MSDWSEHDERMLERLVTGDADPNDPEVRAALASNPELARRHAELQQLAGSLDAGWEREQDAWMDELGGADAVLAKVRETARREVQETSTDSDRQPRDSKLGAWILAAAAAVFVGWLALRDWGDSTVDPAKIYLDLAPRGMSPDQSYVVGRPFVWRFDAPVGGHYVLELFDADGTRVHREEIPAPATFWTPPEALHHLFEGTLQWSITVFDAGTAQLDSARRSFRSQR